MGTLTKIMVGMEAESGTSEGFPESKTIGRGLWRGWIILMMNG